MEFYKSDDINPVVLKLVVATLLRVAKFLEKGRQNLKLRIFSPFDQIGPK